jgi:hypothetical protein
MLATDVGQTRRFAFQPCEGFAPVASADKVVLEQKQRFLFVETLWIFSRSCGNQVVDV